MCRNRDPERSETDVVGVMGTTGMPEIPLVLASLTAIGCLAFALIALRRTVPYLAAKIELRWGAAASLAVPAVVLGGVASVMFLSARREPPEVSSLTVVTGKAEEVVDLPSQGPR